MIKYQYKLLIVTILCCISSLSFAEISDKSLNKILDLSGLTAQIEQFPDLIKVGMETAKQQGNPISDAKYNAIKTSVNESVLPSEILEYIRQSLKKSISEQEAQQLLLWYESDLGKEITNAEEKASTAESYQHMMQSAESLLAKSQHVKFANRLDELLGTTDMAMTLQNHTSIAVYSAVVMAIQPDTPLNIEPFKAQIDAASSQTRAALEQIVVLSFVYSYQEIALDKLNKYETFLNKPAAMKFSSIAIASMNRGLETSLSKWAEALAVILTSKH
ncbi:MAG: DUF2059 domain-containing protein [Methylophagaceae bacterium]